MLLKDFDYLFPYGEMINLTVCNGDDYEFYDHLSWISISPYFRRMEVIDIHAECNGLIRILVRNHNNDIQEETCN